jgi:hypothetical protein
MATVSYTTSRDTTRVTVLRRLQQFPQGAGTVDAKQRLQAPEIDRLKWVFGGRGGRLRAS